MHNPGSVILFSSVFTCFSCIGSTIEFNTGCTGYLLIHANVNSARDMSAAAFVYAKIYNKYLKNGQLQSASGSTIYCGNYSKLQMSEAAADRSRDAGDDPISTHDAAGYVPIIPSMSYKCKLSTC